MPAASWPTGAVVPEKEFDTQVMMATRIDVLREVSPPRGIGPDSVVISFAELCRELRLPAWLETRLRV